MNNPSEKYRNQMPTPNKATLAAWRLADQKAAMVESLTQNEEDDDNEIALHILSSIIK